MATANSDNYRVILAAIVAFMTAGGVLADANDGDQALPCGQAWVLETGADAVRARLSTLNYEIADARQGHEILVEDFGYLLVPGKPKLPARIFAFAIPPGAEVVEVTYDRGQGIVLPGAYEIAPGPLTRVIGQENPSVYQQRQRVYEENYAAVYGGDDPYPQDVVEFVRTAGYRKYDLVDVRVTPFTYRPLSRELTYWPDITVQIRYRLADNGDAPMVDNLARTERMAEEVIANYEQAGSWYPAEKSGDRGLHDFVIITLDSLTSSVTPLVNWEISKGRTVEVVTTTWIAANYTGYDLAEMMRNFLRDKYPSGEWGIEDVLLVGHYDDVPMRRTAQDLGYGAPETDFYYAELSLPDDQSWDADGDQQYGEDTDSIDFYAEVNVGRIPWSTPSTVESICDKSAAYEQNDDPAFKKNILLLAAFFWDDDPNPRTDTAVLMEAKVDQPWMSDWTMTRMYEQGYSTYPMDYNLTYANVLAVWSSGTFGFVNWAGHGSPTSAHIYHSTGEAFASTSTCPQLNDAYPAIIFADSCSTSDTDQVNLGQSMLQQGAVGYLGSTKVALGCPGWSGPYDGSTQSLDYFFTTSVTQGDRTQGQAQQWALQQMYTYGLFSYNKYETFEWGALWGNPDLGMGDPPMLAISLPEGLPEYVAPGESTDLTVDIDDGQENYVPGSGLLHYRYDGGAFLTSPLVHLSGDLYQATLPGADCSDAPEYYVSAEGDQSGVVYSPPGAPAETYSALVGGYVTFMTEDLAGDPGWTTQGQWAFGQPTGGGGEYGGPDPTSGYTGDNVYGYNLAGDYPNNLSQQHLTSTAIDCTGRQGVRLRFWRWLGVEQSTYDHAYVRVSNNGTGWTTVWKNAGEVTDYSWVEVELDISAVADNQPTVYLRWTMGATDGGWRYCGWNIDDVSLAAFDCVNQTPPTIVDAASVVTHATAGDFGSVMSAGTIIEHRANGATKLVVNFDMAMDPATTIPANVSATGLLHGAYAGTVGTSLAGGDQLTITFDPALDDMDRYTVDLSGMAAAGGGPELADPTFEVVTLRGDVNHDLSANTTDASVVKLCFGQPSGETNWAHDYNNDGEINTTDFSQVKLHFGNSAP